MPGLHDDGEAPCSAGSCIQHFGASPSELPLPHPEQVESKAEFSAGPLLGSHSLVERRILLYELCFHMTLSSRPRKTSRSTPHGNENQEREKSRHVCVVLPN